MSCFQNLSNLTRLTCLHLKGFRKRHWEGVDKNPFQDLLPHLRERCLSDVSIGQIRTIAFAWQSLHTLRLDRNGMTRLPGNLSILTALTHLDMENQHADFQIVAPLKFLTQLQNLRVVKFAAHPEYPWNVESLCIFTQARMLIDETPTCHVQLSVYGSA
ncbi:hypothetical protein WJX73_003448 [Symbiochloris irregularis]|uniref:Uncharacterized protein n=1 Tax=Symbiochloris irregularis TaxID=706552 RepID=A0AAW1NKL1_9CHLO